MTLEESKETDFDANLTLFYLEDESVVQEELPKELQNMLEHLEMWRPKVIESENINLGTDSEPRMVKIGLNLPATQKRVSCRSLKMYLPGRMRICLILIGMS